MAASVPNMGDPNVQRYLDWLCTIKRDREPSTQKALAAEMGINDQYLSDWKANAVFFDEWQRRYRRTVGNPERQHAVLEALFETATDRTDPRQVPAARAYLEAIDAVKPKKVDVTMTKDVDKLTDAEIDALIAAETSGA